MFSGLQLLKGPDVWKTVTGRASRPADMGYPSDWNQMSQMRGADITSLAWTVKVKDGKAWGKMSAFYYLCHIICKIYINTYK